jgi:hypothetical protein
LEVKNAKRRIPPIGDVGAGGEKYVYDGMFFKMARDHASGVSLYGGDEFAMCVLPLEPGVPPSEHSDVYLCPLSITARRLHMRSRGWWAVSPRC